MEDWKRLVAYILSRLGCTHPFRVTRILALAELRALERGLPRISNARYVPGPGVFYVEGFKEAIQGDDCFYKREGDPERGVRGCIGYRCEPPSIPGEIAELLDEAIEASKGLDDMELNRLVIEHPLFKRLAGEEG